ncbi:VanZ family protein [uncultured Lutibacter sp.]|uniref:VanZ family protein n=1 Tax=uncultured Lutibacter sp. TaxID=437739 RepID=UPI00345D9DDF
MQTIIKNLLERKLYFFVAIYFTIVITIGSLISINSIIKLPSVNYLDKFLHILAYFLLTLSWLFALKKSFKLKKKFVLLIIVIFIYGIIIEVLQGSFTNYRQADIYDMFANLGGILIAYVFFNTFFKRN